jgi:hypothetical protein
MLRLDPFALPVRYSASDPAADAQVREVELHRERVVVRRSLGGMRMALNLPLSAFSGIALRVTLGETGAGVTVELAHKDPGLVLPLFVSREADDAMAEWRAWGAVLGLPLLVQDAEKDGFREPFARLGAVRLAAVKPRRRRRSALRKRRPLLPLRRRKGAAIAAMPVYRGEREIIARGFASAEQEAGEESTQNLARSLTAPPLSLAWAPKRPS